MFFAIFRRFRPSPASPWHQAPPWALELRNMMKRALTDDEVLMSQAQDLDSAVQALTAGFAALDTAIQPALQVIADNSGSNPIVATAIANIQAISGKMATDAAALTAAIPGATTVSPPATAAPVVTATPDVTPPSIDAPAVTAPDATPPTS